MLPLKIGTTQPQNGLVLRGLGKVVLDLNGVGGTAIQVGRLANGGRITNFTFTVPNLYLPSGQPLVVQGFAWNPATGGPVPGRQVWLQQ